jgi:HlyD family secretion protein
MGMQPAEALFRQEAIKKVSSPEQLDRLMQVTRLRGWIGLATFAAVLLGAILWGIYGAIPTRVAGSGIILEHGGGIVDVQAKGGGRLVAVLVRPGDRVEQGQPIARVDQRDLALSLGQARALATELKAQRDQTAQYYGVYLREQEQNVRDQARNLQTQARDAEENLRTQRRAIETRERDARARLRALEDLLAAEEQLLREGFISKIQVEDMRERVQAAREEVTRARADLAQIDGTTRAQLGKIQTDRQALEIKLLELQNQRTQNLDAYALKLVEANQKVRQLAEDLEETATVTSPAAGTVLDQTAAVGTIVGDRAPIVRIETGGRRLDAVVYVPATTGKEIKPGLRVELTPATVKKEEWGAMLGRVRAVAQFATTTAGMMAVLDNADLVRTFLAAGPLLSVTVELDTDPQAPSGFRWTSNRGPDVRVTPGTLATAQLIVREQPPITLVIPFLKKFFGIS